MKLLDLFCGGGGAAKGYADAGFDVTGIDINPQPRYPYNFYQTDAMEYLRLFGSGYDVIHASPVCKKYSSITVTAGTQEKHPDFIPELRELLIATGKPYIIENVEGAPLKNPILLCGTMFPGLNVIRHRIFETSPVIWFPPAPCNHQKLAVCAGRKADWARYYHCPVGNFSDVGAAKKAMGIDWLGQKGLAQAIPPAYTEWIGRRLLEQLQNEK